MTSKQLAYIDALAKKIGLINWSDAVVKVHGKACPAHLITDQGASRIIDWLKSPDALREFERDRMIDARNAAFKAAKAAEDAENDEEWIIN